MDQAWNPEDKSTSTPPPVDNQSAPSKKLLFRERIPPSCGCLEKTQV